MRRPHLFALVVVGVLAAPSAASAAPCDGGAGDAAPLVDGVRASCTSGAGERALFRWQPAVAAPAVVDLEGTTFDAVLDVYREARGGGLGERITSWDQGDPRAAEHVAFDGDGAAVVFVVRPYRAGDGGTVAIAVGHGAPRNTSPEAALPIALGDDGLGAAGMHWGGAMPAGLAAASMPARWFRFTASRSGRMTASTCTSYAGDTLVAAYGVEADRSLTLLASNDDSPLGCQRDGASFAGFPVVAGRDYRIAVRAARSDGLGPETLVLGWDDQAPPASVDVGPTGVVSDRSAAFAWSSPAADAVGFECSLDGGPFGSCARGYTGLADGEHAFRVRALDAAGNVGPAAERSWRVTTGAATTAAPAAAKRVTVETRRVTGPRSARARGLALAFDGGPAARFSAGARGTRVLLLSLRGAKAGTRVQVRCERRANGCPFTTRTVRRGADLAKLFRRRALSPGAVIELRVTRPGTVGRLFRWEMRARKRPRGRALCLPPGTARPAAC